MMSAIHFKAPGTPSWTLLPLLFPIIYSLTRNAGCLLDCRLRELRPIWKECRENPFDVLAMAGIDRMGMPKEQLDQWKGA
jgi:hypothetical protein